MACTALVGTNLLKLHNSTGLEYGKKYLIIFGDYFTKWVEAYLVADWTKEIIVSLLLEEFVCCCGMPVLFHSDNGTNFFKQALPRNM